MMNLERSADVSAARVLVVDDDPEFVTAASVHLKSRGFQVTSTWNADGALDLLSKERFDAVVLDNGLPGRMGVAALPQLVQKSPAPVLLVSAHPSDDLSLDARLLGARGFMAKPVDWEALAEKLRALIAGRAGPAPSSGAAG